LVERIHRDTTELTLQCAYEHLKQLSAVLKSYF
jgi:hypothetical protein